MRSAHKTKDFLVEGGVECVGFVGSHWNTKKEKTSKALQKWAKEFRWCLAQEREFYFQRASSSFIGGQWEWDLSDLLSMIANVSLLYSCRADAPETNQNTEFKQCMVSVHRFEKCQNRSISSRM